MSAQSYSRDMAKLSVAKMLQTIGWNSINTTPLEILTDILAQYLHLISKTANDYANEFGCTEPNLDHIGLAFRDCHVNLNELEEYVTFVDFAQPPVPVPKYPLAKENNLNFLKPGSKECLTRPVHIHEHLPPISVAEADSDSDANSTVSVKMEDIKQDVNGKHEDCDSALFKRPAEVSPSDNLKRTRNASAISGPFDVGAYESLEQQGRPTREISSVMMTTSGFISPAREGRLPDSRTPINQGPISEPPSPEPAESPLIDVTTTDDAQGPIQPATAATTTPSLDVATEPVNDVKLEVSDFDNRAVPPLEQPDEHLQLVQSVTGAAPGLVSAMVPSLTPAPKKPKAPRKLDPHAKQRREKPNFVRPSGEAPMAGFGAQPSERQPHLPAAKPRKSANQANRVLARQMKKHQQQLIAATQAYMQSNTELDQPMNLSTNAPPQQQQPHPHLPEVEITKAKAKANRTLAAARRKTEKLNTTITPIPMPMAIQKPSIDKLFSEPDKKKVNILKKISNVHNELKPPARTPQVEDDGQVHQMLPSDVTIELVDMRNNQQQLEQALDQPEMLPGPSAPVKEKRKRKERVAKPRKVPKQATTSTPWEDMEIINRPNSPDVAHTHNFPAALNKLGLSFPFLSQFSGPGLIPNYNNNPMFPNNFQMPNAFTFNSLLQQHNPYLADHGSNNNEQHTEPQPSTSAALTPYQPPTHKPGRPRKQPQPSTSYDVAFPTHQVQPLVSSTTMSPNDSHRSASQQVTVVPSTVSSPALVRDQSSNNSSPSHAVVGSTVQLTPPSPAAGAAVAPSAPLVSSLPSTSSATATIPSTSVSVKQEDELQQLPKVEKKNREHKKDRKDKVKKKNKKDRVKKDKLEKKKERDKLKIKLKKEKKEKKKEKDMMRSNISDNITVPKLTLKLGSPSSKAGQLDVSAAESSKLMVKPIILRKEENSISDDNEKKRESSPELARILPLVTGQPKPKSVQPAVSSTSHSHTGDFSLGTKKYPVFKPIPRLAEIVTEEATSSTTILPRNDTSPVRPSKYIDSLGNEVWICPNCGKQDDGSPMIGCDDCDGWYHWVCVNMQVPPEENEDWYCKNCIKKRAQSSMPPEKKKKRKKKDKKEH